MTVDVYDADVVVSFWCFSDDFDDHVVFVIEVNTYM